MFRTSLASFHTAVRASAGVSPAVNLVGKSYLMPTLRLTDSLDLGQFIEALKKRISLAPMFYAHAPVVLDVDEMAGSLSEPALRDCIESLRRLQLHPVGITGASPSLKELAARAGVPLLVGSASSQTAIDVNAIESISVPAKLDATTKRKRKGVSGLEPTTVVDTHVRSGQQVYAAGDLVVLGSVNSGAEVLANGDIHVYGTLKGRALAGVGGDPKRLIFAQRFEAELVSVGNIYTICEELPDLDRTRPAMIKLNEKGKDLEFVSIHSVRPVG